MTADELKANRAFVVCLFVGCLLAAIDCLTGWQVRDFFIVEVLGGLNSAGESAIDLMEWFFHQSGDPGTHPILKVVCFVLGLLSVVLLVLAAVYALIFAGVSLVALGVYQFLVWLSGDVPILKFLFADVPVILVIGYGFGIIGGIIGAYFHRDLQGIMKKSVKTTEDNDDLVIEAESWDEDCAHAISAALDAMGRKRDEVKVIILHRERHGLLGAVGGVKEAHVKVNVLPHILEKEEKERDRTFDRVVNCPFCYGAGDLIYYENDVGRHYGSKPTVKHPGHDCRNLALDGIVRPREGNPGVFEYFSKRDCPFCLRTGTAYGYYADTPCAQCQGSGYTIKKELVRQDVGVIEVGRKKPCRVCSGSGSVPILRFRPTTKLNHVPNCPEDVHYGDGVYWIQLTARNESVLRKSRLRF